MSPTVPTSSPPPTHPPPSPNLHLPPHSTSGGAGSRVAGTTSRLSLACASFWGRVEGSGRAALLARVARRLYSKPSLEARALTVLSSMYRCGISRCGVPDAGGPMPSGQLTRAAACHMSARAAGGRDGCRRPCARRLRAREAARRARPSTGLPRRRRREGSSEGHAACHKATLDAHATTVGWTQIGGVVYMARLCKRTAAQAWREAPVIGARACEVACAAVLERGEREARRWSMCGRCVADAGRGESQSAARAASRWLPLALPVAAHAVHSF